MNHQNVEAFNVQTPSEGIVTEPESPWQSKDPLKWYSENGLSINKNQIEIFEIEEVPEEKFTEISINKIWDHVTEDVKISNHRTWETLGQLNPSKELPCVSESIDATLHIINVAQDSFPLNEVSFLLLRFITSFILNSNIKIIFR